MRISRTDRDDYMRLADVFGISVTDVSSIVVSYFDTVLGEARSLPFANPRKVFSKDMFDRYGSVHQIPSVGRLGPSYTRYRRWKANESANVGMVNRTYYSERLRKEDIENIADTILSGTIPDIAAIKKGRKGKYNKVWHVGSGGRKLAWQAIKKH